jgi:multimeric flavodoxin WrbA
MGMRAIGIAGSYRKSGVVDTAVGEVLAGATEAGAEVEKVLLGDHHLEYCRNYRFCTQAPGESNFCTSVNTAWNQGYSPAWSARVRYIAEAEAHPGWRM